MSNKLRLQITERYKRNVFINVVVPEGRLYEFDCILDNYENFIKELGFEDYGYRKLKKYGVHDIRRGKLIYIGFLRDIKEEFFEDKYTLEHIKKATYSNKLLENRYLIRKDIA